MKLNTALARLSQEKARRKRRVTAGRTRAGTRFSNRGKGGARLRGGKKNSNAVTRARKAASSPVRAVVKRRRTRKAKVTYEESAEWTKSKICAISSSMWTGVEDDQLQRSDTTKGDHDSSVNQTMDWWRVQWPSLVTEQSWKTFSCCP